MRDHRDDNDGILYTLIAIVNIDTTVTTDTGSGEKVNRAYLRVEICLQIQPEPVDFCSRKTLASKREGIAFPPA